MLTMVHRLAARLLPADLRLVVVLLARSLNPLVRSRTVAPLLLPLIIWLIMVPIRKVLLRLQIRRTISRQRPRFTTASFNSISEADRAARHSKSAAEVAIIIIRPRSKLNRR